MQAGQVPNLPVRRTTSSMTRYYPDSSDEHASPSPRWRGRICRIYQQVMARLAAMSGGG